MTIAQHSKKMTLALLMIGSGLAAGLGQQPTAKAEHRSDTQPANFFAGQLRDSAGAPVSMATSADTALYRAGTDPLAPLTDVNGDPITWGQYNGAGGTLSITHRAEGGTAMHAEMWGLLPGELYSFWAGYFPAPGFPATPASDFGAMSAMGDGSDNYQVADADGKITMDVVQLGGPATQIGSVLSYGPDAATGWDVGVALHFGDYPQPPFLDPGPAHNWALATATHFATIPEPSSIALTILAGCALAGVSRSGRNR